MWQLQCHLLLLTLLSETELEDPQKVLWCAKYNYCCISLAISWYMSTTLVLFTLRAKNLQARRCGWPDLPQKASR
jgi:hypothetical protein